MPYTYILRCADGTYYTGSTWDLDRRIAEHQAGLGSAYTRERRPICLVHAVFHDRVEAAYRLEKRVQGWSRAKKEAFMRGDLATIRRLAHAHGASGR